MGVFFFIGWGVGGWLGSFRGGGGGRKEETTAWSLARGFWTPEQLKKGYCGRSGDVYAQLLFVAAHSTSSS